MTTLSRQRLQQLAEEAKALADWTTVRDFALQMYGDKAVSIEIETYGDSDDEGGMDYSIESVTAYDKDGNELPFDHSLPFFSSATWGKEEAEDATRDDEDEEEDEGNYEDFSDFKCIDYLAAEDKKHGWILIEDLPVDKHNGTNEIYDLTRPPSLSLPIA